MMQFFYIIQSLARRAYYSFRDNRLDKAQTEMSVSYPAFFVLRESEYIFSGGSKIIWIFLQVK